MASRCWVGIRGSGGMGQYVRYVLLWAFKSVPWWGLEGLSVYGSTRCAGGQAGKHGEEEEDTQCKVKYGRFCFRGSQTERGLC